jgi:hypothetical protein
MKIFRKDGLQKAPPFVEALEKEKKNDDAASFGGHPSDFLYKPTCTHAYHVTRHDSACCSATAIACRKFVAAFEISMHSIVWDSSQQVGWVDIDPRRQRIQRKKQGNSDTPRFKITSR